MGSSQDITTVFFDYGDTLVENRPTYLKRVAEVLGEFGYEHCNQVPPKKLSAVWDKLLDTYLTQQAEEAKQGQPQSEAEPEQGTLV